MLTPLTTKDDDDIKISPDYYSPHYTPQSHHYYYHPGTFNDDSNNLHHPQTPNLYDPAQYYTLSPGYSHPQGPTRMNEEDSTPSMYMPVYHRHHYSPEEMVFSQKPIDQQSPTIYDYNLSPNQVFHQHQSYIPTPTEQTPCSTSTGGEYLTPYVC